MSYVVTFVVGAVLGALASYLALRNNPAVKAQVDAQTDKIAGKL